MIPSVLFLSHDSEPHTYIHTYIDVYTNLGADCCRKLHGRKGKNVVYYSTETCGGILHTNERADDL